MTAREGLTARVQTAGDTAKEAEKLPALIERQGPEIERALPVHLKLNAEQYVRAALTLIKQTPALATCNPRTILGGMMTAAQLGLEFGPLGHAYLVPFKNNGRQEAQFILGYKGIIDLCWRSGNLASIVAREVCENDEFDFEYGLADSLHHKTDPRKERGPAYAYYGMAKFKDGGHTFVVLGMPEVNVHRARSKSWTQSKDRTKTPWGTDYDAMARKTCIRIMQPFLPLTTEIARQLLNDGAVVRGTSIDNLEAEQVEYIDVDAVDEEIADGEIIDGDEGFDGPSEDHD